MAARIVAGLALASFLVTGCADGVEFPGEGTTASGLKKASARVQVIDAGFTIAGPRGFCVDTGATRETADGAFVVLGSCAVISGNPEDEKPRDPAVLTASVIPAGATLDTAALDRMAQFLSTEAGRAALARGDGNGDNVRVIDIDRERGLVLVHAEDGDHSGDVAGDFWRGVFETAGHLVTVTVSGFREAPLDGPDGRRLARAFVAAIRKANPDGSPPEDDQQAEDGMTLRLASFFNRLR